jgi:hypothetical protein
VRPRGTEIGDVAEWVTEVVSRMAADQVSMALDMGAGDSVLEEHAKQMDLCEFCEASGIAPLAIYSLGPTMDDFNDAMTIYEKGYAQCERTLFVMNESLVENGKGAAGAFNFVMEDARYQAIEHNVRSVVMPKLACMKAMRDEKLSVYEAAEGERGTSGRPMSLGHQFIVKTWINRMEARLSLVAGSERARPGPLTPEGALIPVEVDLRQDGAPERRRASGSGRASPAAIPRRDSTASRSAAIWCEVRHTLSAEGTGP